MICGKSRVYNFIRDGSAIKISTESTTETNKKQHFKSVNFHLRLGVKIQ